MACQINSSDPRWATPNRSLTFSEHSLTLARVGLPAAAVGRPPGTIVVKWGTLLAVIPRRVVSAPAPAGHLEDTAEAGSVTSWTLPGVIYTYTHTHARTPAFCVCKSKIKSGGAADFIEQVKSGWKWRFFSTSQQVRMQSRHPDAFQTKIIKCHARTLSSQRGEKRKKRSHPLRYCPGCC